MKKFLLILFTMAFICNAAVAEGSISRHISMGYGNVVAIQDDGTVKALDKRCDTSAWENVIQVYAGSNHVLGLKADGTVYATGDNKYGQCNVEKWMDIVMVAAGNKSSYGLKKDGTIVSTTRRTTKKSGAWKKWANIVWIDVSDEDDSLYAIDRDGKLYSLEMDLSRFHDAVQVYRIIDEIDVLLKDGTVEYMTCYDDYEKISKHYEDEWTDVCELDSVNSCIVALRGNGEVDSTSAVPYYAGWQDIVEIEYFLGVRSDGTILCSWLFSDIYTPEEMNELATWKVMVDPNTLPATAAPTAAQ